MKTLPLVSAVAFLCLLAGCSSSKHTPTVTTMQVSPGSPSVAAGLTQQFKATATFSDSTTQDVTSTAQWSSGTASVATVNSSGLATSHTQGGSTITATFMGVSGTANLTVTAATLVSIGVTPANATQSPATFQQYKATGNYTDNSTQDLTGSVTWSSTTGTVASISSGGLVTAETDGGTTIGAALGSVNGNTPLTVAPPTLQSIVLSDTNLTIAQGTSHQFLAFGVYSDGGKRDISNQVTWASTATNFATISSQGLAQGVAAGGTTISATMGAVSQNTTLTVSSATVSSIVVGPTTRSIAPLTLLAFAAIGTFSDGSTQNITRDVTWTSSANGIATFVGSPSPGVIKGVSAGPATVTATLGSTFGTAAMQVSSATLTSITLTTSSTNVAVGSAFEVEAIGHFTDATTQAIGSVVTWNTSAPTVATVNSIGAVNALTTGTTTISALLAGINGSVNLTVENATALTFAPTSVSVAPNTVANFKATATLTDSSTQTVTGSTTWTSSALPVALAGDASNTRGQVFALTTGNSVIGGVFDGIVTSATVTVTGATLSSLSITPANPTVPLDEVQDFKATGTFSDSTTQVVTGQVTWTSSDLQVAIISPDGVATPTGSGTTTITAEMGGVNTTTVMTVP